MTVLFVITTIIAASIALGLAMANASLGRQREEWCDRYLDAANEVVTLTGRLNDFQHPPNRGMTEPIDAEAVIANSDDPIWKLVEDCYDLKPRWELCIPGEGAKQPHQRYSDFATFILNLPEADQNHDGIAAAVTRLEMGVH